MSSREVMLSRIRAALGDTATPAEIPREYRRGDQVADLDLLVERLEDYKAVVHRGVSIAETADGMTIEGGRALTGGDVQSHGDHRLAMALAAAALAGTGDVRIDGAGVVAVSYPGFWDDLAKLAQ